MKTIIVYHDTQTKARRARPPQSGETISYRDIAEWDENENARFDEVVDLSNEVREN